MHADENEGGEKEEEGKEEEDEDENDDDDDPTAVDYVASTNIHTRTQIHLHRRKQEGITSAQIRPGHT